ncbi:hypothetical protein ANACAC_02694 [Anaerostipes caccae L1-92]|uniref:Uncharacterized protein n=1 Tax=Anaerostipes caccae (strain DSM 14662 / CCUG 47493 / JCM 13470 / NCIMB 13811 / L1-92) TaxID=411490 RepID=B0MGI1_ANACD|nr:hypothetical protein ANACAC_02694 [Anaerostipes caccae L1-92]
MTIKNYQIIGPAGFVIQPVFLFCQYGFCTIMQESTYMDF